MLQFLPDTCRNYRHPRQMSRRPTAEQSCRPPILALRVDQRGDRGATADGVLASKPTCRRLAHSQFALAISAVTHIKRSSRRLSAVISARAIATPTILSTGPSGILKASAFGRSLRNRISEAQPPAYKTINVPEVSATSQRKVPLDASTHPVTAYSKMAAVGV